MRWLFFLLLAVNLGILIWGIQQERFFSAQKMEAPDPEIGNLRLLSELEIADLASAGSATAGGPTDTQPPASKPAAVESPVEEETLEQPTATAVADDQGRPPLPAADDAAVDRSVAETGPLPTPLQTAVPEKPAAEAGQGSVAEARVASTAEITQPQPAESCGVIGPLEPGPLPERIARALERRGVQVSMRSETIDKTVGFWVIIPPYESRQKAIDEVKRLNQEGVMDVRRFYRGEFRNGISLGMFSRQRNAERRRRQIAAKGFSPEILPRTREAEVSLIDYRARGEDAGRGLKETIADYPDLEHQVQSCPQEITQ